MAINWRYFLDFLMAPLAGIILLAHSFTLTAPLSFACGYIAWVFYEWFTHAMLLHEPKAFRREHWVHHIRPSDTKVNEAVPWWLTSSAIVLAVLFGIQSGPDASATSAGFVLGYASYLWMHHAIHQEWINTSTRGLGAAVARHNYHHTSGREVNFNVLCPLADRVLGTFQACS